MDKERKDILKDEDINSSMQDNHAENKDLKDSCDEKSDIATEVDVKDENAEATSSEEVAKEDKKDNKKRGFFSTIWVWFKRFFMGHAKEDVDVFSVEAIESPAKQVVKAFFSNKLALVAVIVLVIMFGLAFIGPLFTPLDLSYQETAHKHIAPGFNMMKVPGKLKGDVKSISSYGSYSIGVSNSGEMYVWGNTKIPNSPIKSNMKNLPKELEGKKIAFASAGSDHAVAITTDGKVVCWGEYENGQYGDKGSMANNPTYVMKMPDFETIELDVNEIKQLECADKVTAIVMKDGSAYAWGSFTGAKNLKKVKYASNSHLIDKVSFTGTSVVILQKDGTAVFDFDKYDNYEVSEGKIVSLTGRNGEDSYFGDRKILDIATTNSSIAFVMDDGELIITGSISDSNKNNIAIPTFADDEKIIDIGGGRKHYTVLSDKGVLYSFGNNTLHQCDVKKCDIQDDTRILIGSFQNYIINGNQLETQWGLKGYLMGTDEFGRDVFNRIINGGKMTMTVGAIAVIISSIIGIIIGCISGYFGGWVDMLLMRVTEIFSAIPFLPFALILSAILAGSNLTENIRIFMIMVILGLLSWTGLAKMVRGQVLAEREKEFVLAAKSMGVKESKIAFKHILPNIISVILVNMTLDFAGCMLTEASLSYLGFGVQLPRPTWGNMLNGCNNEIVIAQFWWRWLFPAIFLLLTTISINIIGDTLRDVMDPKSSREK